MKINLIRLKKPFIITLLITTHLATVTTALCIEDIQQIRAHAAATAVIEASKCLQTSHIAFEQLSTSDKSIIIKHIERLDTVTNGFKQTENVADSISHFLHKLAKNQISRNKNHIPPINGLNQLINDAFVPGEPLKCYMLGFPVKAEAMNITGPEHKAALGDFLSLLTLHYISHKLSEIHTPGVNITVICDYAALHPYVNHSKAMEYQESIQSIVKLFPKITYDTTYNNASKTPPVIFNTTLEKQPYHNNTVSRALTQGTADLSIQEVSSEIVRRSGLFSEYISTKLKDSGKHLRFSVHRQEGFKEKIAIPFLNGKLGTSCHAICTINSNGESQFQKFSDLPKKVILEKTSKFYVHSVRTDERPEHFSVYSQGSEHGFELLYYKVD